MSQKENKAIPPPNKILPNDGTTKPIDLLPVRLLHREPQLLLCHFTAWTWHRVGDITIVILFCVSENHSFAPVGIGVTYMQRIPNDRIGLTIAITRALRQMAAMSGRKFHEANQT